MFVFAPGFIFWYNQFYNKRRDKMEIKLMSATQLEELYANHMFRDFPAPEIKPLSTLKRLLGTGEYVPLAFIEDGGMIGYTLLIACGGKNSCLLDYFAVLPQFRSGGRGSMILKYLREHFLGKTHQILIECEHPDFAPDRAQALRRLKFYNNAGAKKAEIETKLFGVRYLVYALTCDNTAQPLPVHDDIAFYYGKMVGNGDYNKEVEIYI